MHQIMVALLEPGLGQVLCQLHLMLQSGIASTLVKVTRGPQASVIGLAPPQGV